MFSMQIKIIIGVFVIRTLGCSVRTPITVFFEAGANSVRNQLKKIRRTGVG